MSRRRPDLCVWLVQSTGSSFLFVGTEPETDAMRAKNWIFGVGDKRRVRSANTVERRRHRREGAHAK